MLIKNGKIISLKERIKLAYRVLKNGNMPATKPLDPSRVPSYFSEEMQPDAPTLMNALDIADFNAFAKSFLDSNGIIEGSMAEIGGSISENASSYFKQFEYINLDIEDNPKIPTRRIDICDPDLAAGDCLYDFIFSRWVFEHLERPWTAANNLIRMLKSGGIIVTITIFSWRYHPVPRDYWRYTPESLSSIFSALETIQAGFINTYRRANVAGIYPNGSDAVPLDSYGGWLESWGVYHVGIKK